MTEEALFSELCMADMRPTAKSIVALKKKRPDSKSSLATVDF